MNVQLRRKSKTVGFFLAATPEQKWDLVNRIVAGDLVAESELVEHYAKPIKLILFKRTGSASLANDLCQDTFVEILKKLRAGDLNKPHCLSAFIRQTAVNISIAHFHKERRYVHQDNGTISLHHSIRGHKPKELDNQTARVAIENALDQLGVARDREILRRFYLADEDKETICMDLKLSAAHVDQVLYRAKKIMRELIVRQKGLKTALFGYLFDA